MTTATSPRRTASRTTTPESSRPAPALTAPGPTGSGTAVPVGPGGPYRLPVIRVGLPSGVVEKGFWAALVGSAVLGAVDPPLAALVGAGVLIARHRRG